MKFKKLLQKIFKKFFQFLFHIIYGKVRLISPETNIGLKKFLIKKILINDKEYNVENNIYEVSEARIYTDLVEHVAIIKNNIIVPEISYQQVNGELKNTSFNKVLKNGTTRLKKKFNGNVLSLVQGASGNNYFHFLFDVVSKLLIFEQKFDFKNIDYFYMPNDFDWQKKIISKFDIPENKLINSQKYRHINANKIFAVEHPWYKKGIIQEEIANLPEWIIHSLRNKFLKYKKKFSSMDKIFIDRSDSIFNHCKLINNQEVIDFLVTKGFRSYQTSKLDFFEQIYLFNNARVIIGPHGAAFSNIIFSQPGLNLIEFIPKEHQSVKCERISRILDFNYKRVGLDTLKFNQPNAIGDIRVELNYLNQILNSFDL